MAPSLRSFLVKHIEQRASEIAPSSVERLRDTQGLLEACFGPEMALDAITADMAHDWRATYGRK